MNDAWLEADAYEAFMGRWSRVLAVRFVEWLHPAFSAHWLEVGCGTGALTSAIHSRCEPASIVACDPSTAMLEHGRRELDDSRTTFVVAGADDLPRRSGGFDVVVSGMALNFFPDPQRAMASFRERVRPGGVVAACVWDYAERMAFLRCFWDEAAVADPRAAELDEGRRFPLCRPDALAASFTSAGLRGIETGAIEIPTVFADFDDFWRPFLRGTGPAPSYVASLDDAGRAVLRERLRTRLGNGKIELRARAWAVLGTSG